MGGAFDVAVIGMGPGGEVAADRLINAGLRVVLFESGLIGGECAYWACIPSKTVLRGPEVRGEANRAAGPGDTGLDWEQARDHRDFMARHLDDGNQVAGYAGRGAIVVKESARLLGPGVIEAGGSRYGAGQVIIATGTEALLPALEGIGDITAWTNRETYTTPVLPASAIIVGGSAVGVETAVFLAGFGIPVTLLHRGPTLLGREEPRVGELAGEHLRAAGVDLRFSASAVRARKEGGESVLELDDGTQARAAVVIFATGRTARTRGLGLEEAGARLDGRGNIVVDGQCRAAQGLYAIGDVTGTLSFTHVAKYQGRIAADAILGREHAANYEGIPRVVFADPEIAAVGLTRAQAEAAGLLVSEVVVDLAAAIARPWTYERNPRGEMGLLLDEENQVLIGAWAVSPLAGEWIHFAALAIRARIPLEVLRDSVPQFPSYTEGYLAAFAKL
ncbi:dihydrolipoyl dehydrogenase family protein [Paeniglutamicibacter cryotolerans]|uniref:Dihydrolipoamide dehydrogenase n=1 Tax=Paeniglutamicibacter cryotolerans TaxID=670079 RepID=A0A839QQY8_9MICC|nr:NAD(P)/FAD-dependent oxidoreductase [Paeniglutamicibacter cryotolerans]MBB2997075.1 dihydrolipoamide dehydrogenase [Paeniglutamicibacter cryotolerans]